MGLRYTHALLGVPLFFAAISAHGQAANAGDIRGTATDASGALLPDVTVTVTNTGTGVAKVLTKNKDGLYDSGPIVTGNYSITFTKDSFATFTRSGLNLDVSTPRRWTFKHSSSCRTLAVAARARRGKISPN